MGDMLITDHGGSRELTDTERIVEAMARKDERRRVIEELRLGAEARVTFILDTVGVDMRVSIRGLARRIVSALLGEPEKKRWKPKDGRCVCDWDSDKITWFNPSCPVHLQDAPTQYRDMVAEQEGK